MKVKEILKIFLQKLCLDKEVVDYVCGGGEALPLPLSPEEESLVRSRKRSKRAPF